MLSLGVNSLVVTGERSINRNVKNLRQFNNNKSNGVISDRSKSKLKNLIVNYCTTEQNYIKEIIGKNESSSVNVSNLARHELKFVTLTIPPTISETDTIVKKKYLNPYLTWLGRNGVSHYIWTAEAQANGQIHFHLIINAWHKEYTTKWQSLTSNYTQYAIQDRPIKNIQGLANYMTKEPISSARKLEGRLFGMSNNVKAFENIQIKSAVEEREFFSANDGQLSLSFASEYVVVMKYKYSLRRKMQAKFTTIRRKQDKGSKFSIVVGKNSYRNSPVNSV